MKNIPRFPESIAAMIRAVDYFEVTHVDNAMPEVPVMSPKLSVPLDPTTDGQWFVTGDIDGDGAVEIVTARNHTDEGTPPHVTSVTARKLDGSMLWQWGDPAAGGWRLGYDVACQIHDWDGDGKLEVLLATHSELVELDGATGRERRRLKIPIGASDCLTFVDLSGAGRRGELLVKDRYFNIYAINYDGKLLWHVGWPGGQRTAHQPYPIDIDGDGREEVVVGYALAGPDGKLRWTFEPPVYDEPLGHLDACRVFRRGRTPGDWRLVCTACGHRGILMLDGEGNKLWQHEGAHYESIDIGRLDPHDDSPRIVVDLVEWPANVHSLMIIDEAGTQLGAMKLRNPRLHTTMDLLGLGHDQIVLPSARAVFGHRGQWLARLDLPAYGDIVQKGDMTGSGRVGMAVSTPDTEGEGRSPIPAKSMIHMFEITHPHAAKTDVLGCGENYTLY